MSKHPGDPIRLVETITDSTGQLATPTVGPTPVLWRNGVPTAVVIAVDEESTGKFVFTGEYPEGYADGDDCDILIDFTVDGIASSSRISRVTLEAPNTTDHATSAEVAEVLTAVSDIKTQTDKFADITKATFERMADVIAGFVRLLNAAGTSLQLIGRDGSVKASFTRED